MTTEVTYRVGHKGVESTPHSLAELRTMWRRRDIDESTEFRRSDSTIWIQAKDMPEEMRTKDEPILSSKVTAVITGGGGGLRPGTTAAPTAAPVAVRVTSIRIPFAEIVRLVMGFALAACLLTLTAFILWAILRRFVG